MSTTLSHLDNQQDALTVFLNFQQEERREIIEERMESLFDGQQYLYLEGNDWTGEELYHYIREKRDNFDIVLPANHRLVFCYYMKLNDLTEDWFERYKERIEALKQLLPVDHALQHYHIACFSYENITPLGNRKAEIIRILKQFHKYNAGVLHAEYLLYASGFHTLDSQERGLVQMLHILSRRGYFRVLQPTLHMNHLKILGYSDYYEDRAVSCQEKIQEITRWQQEENDPELNGLRDAMLQTMQPQMVELREAIKNFKKRVPLYPVSVRDFKRRWIFWHSSMVTDKHPAIQKRRAEFLRDMRAVLAEKTDFSELERIMKTELTCLDLVHLKRELEQGILRQKILTSAENQDKTPEVLDLAENIWNLAEVRIQNILNGLEEKQMMYEKEKRKYQRELDLAGKYRSLQDCFDSIKEDTAFMTPAGIFPENTEMIALVSGNCYNVWLDKRYEINGFHSAYYCQEIAPCEIVLLKKGDYINMAEEDAETKLSQILN